MTPASSASRLRSCYRRWRPEILLAAIVLLLAGPIVQPRLDQQQSRLALTAAIWDDGTFVLDRYEAQLGVDRAVRDGHLYSDKAPGQPVLAIPAYALYRGLGGDPAIDEGVFGNLGLWATSLLTSVVPAILLVVLMRRLALRVAPERATVAALAMATATMLLPFATQLFAHLLTAVLVLSAYLLLVREETAKVRLLAAGLLTGTAVAVEYPAALLAVVLLAAATGRHRLGARWFVAGTVIPGALLAAHHWAAFGGPLRFSYRYSQFTEHQSGVLGVDWPSLSLLGEVLYGDRGLFALTPLVLVGIVGAALVASGNGAGRCHGVVALAMIGTLLLVQAGWANAWGGNSPGPRYLVPALPFLVVGVARAWCRWPLLTAAVTFFSVATMTLATFTFPLLPPEEPSALGAWLDRLADGKTATSVLSMHWGEWALVLPPLAALAVAVALLTRPGADPRPAARFTS